MNTSSQILQRASFAISALVLGVVAVVPALLGGTVYAAQVQDRSIEISDSTPSATGVSYKVTFTPQASATEVIVDFCSNSPIPGDSCTATGGTDVPDVSGVSGPATTSAVQVGATGNYHTIKATGQTLTNGVSYSITFTGITNPSTTDTFYARIFTYGTGGAASYAPTNGSAPTEGSPVDNGGIALSTASVLAVTAKVMETLTFCVSGADLSASDCGSATDPATTIGHTVGTNKVLNAQLVDTAQVFTQTSTNASSGVNVRMKNTNASASCGGLSSDNGTSCDIAAVGITAASIAAGDAKFGMCVAPGSGNTSAVAPYVDSTNTCATPGATTKYGLDDTSANSVLSTYGSSLFKSTGPINQENDTLTLAATAANTTPAGIYTANMALIATGTF